MSPRCALHTKRFIVGSTAAAKWVSCGTNNCVVVITNDDDAAPAGILAACSANRIGIEQRPGVVQQRSRFGDWEADTMQGAKGTGALATHVERKSRYLLARKLPDQRAQTFSHATIKAFAVTPANSARPSPATTAKNSHTSSTSNNA